MVKSSLPAETRDERIAAVSRLVRLCPECGSGDVQFCNISVRPYCNECKTWAPVNFGKAADSIGMWNDRVKKNGWL